MEVSICLAESLRPGWTEVQEGSICEIPVGHNLDAVAALSPMQGAAGGVMVVSDGSGAADTNGVEDRDVFTSLGCKVCGRRQPLRKA